MDTCEQKHRYCKRAIVEIRARRTCDFQLSKQQIAATKMEWLASLHEQWLKAQFESDQVQM